MSPSNRDRLITELAMELYAGYRRWELTKRKTLLVMWIKLSKEEKRGWKRIAEGIVKIRERESEVVNATNQ